MKLIKVTDLVANKGVVNVFWGLAFLGFMMAGSIRLYRGSESMAEITVPAPSTKEEPAIQMVGVIGNDTCFLVDDTNELGTPRIEFRELPKRKKRRRSDGPVTHVLTGVEKRSREKGVSYYSYAMHYLKAREGFVADVYTCPAGFKTVGYGHNISAHGYKYVGKDLLDGRLSYQEATNRLASDLQMQYDVIKEELPHLKHHQILAVSCLALNTGLNKIKYPFGKKMLGKSVFWRNLEQGREPNFMVYVYYKNKRGAKVKSQHLVKARAFETLLFKGKMTMLGTLSENFRQIVIKRDIKKLNQ